MKRAKASASAELKLDRYVKPYAELTVGQLWCGIREVWTKTHGWAGRYHVMADQGVAACRGQEGWKHRSVIVLCRLVPITKVPAHMRCQRNGCRQVFGAIAAPGT